MSKGITTTIGLDLGDRRTRYSVLDEKSGEEVGKGAVFTTPTGVRTFLEGHPRARVVLEVGTHSRWVDRVARECCAEVFVANPRKLRFIYQNDRKSDEVDALALARVARLDPKLLAPILHRSDATQRDLALLRARAGLVSARTKLVNSLRGIVKSFGLRMPRMSTESFGQESLALVPEPLHDVLRPMLVALEGLSGEIKNYDACIEALADEKHPQSRVLTQVYGVGKLTAMAFMLTLEDPGRLRSSRTAGAFFGMVPRRDQSGATEKQLPITKAGDRMVRTLLVQCAQKILTKNAPDSDLKRAGLRIASAGGKAAKRRAVVAVARKLAVLLHALWRSGEVYEPLKTNNAPTT